MVQQGMKLLRFSDFSVTVPASWDDITASLDDAEAPLTIADPEMGVGALQFSPAIYKSGERPQFSLQVLEEMLDEFASNRCLGSPIERMRESNDISIVGSCFRSEADLLRVWYVSDGLLRVSWNSSAIDAN